MAKIIMVIRKGEQHLSVHSKFIVSMENMEICCSTIAHDFIGSKNQLKRLALSHAKKLWKLVEKHPRDTGFYLFDRTPIEIWNGFGILSYVIDAFGHRPFYVDEKIPSIGSSLGGDDIQFFLREFRKALN